MKFGGPPKRRGGVPWGPLDPPLVTSQQTESYSKYVPNYRSLGDEDKIQMVLNFKPLWKKVNENEACETIYNFVKNTYQNVQSGADPGGGSWGSAPLGGPLNFIKREKTLRVCTRKHRVLVLNSYPDRTFPKSCIRP